ncbi:F-box/LRR-repeat protein 6-like [Mercenaria mercenaria]|uniref:F-box/LRR-repeat protein 6-like n=1 Tax=Mercenaria mercenaria TaxID=6596 RepID=UPI00234F2910|nr:F-box/LRR-repeat protein 6-like [Mercenaria mercenaria]
MPKYPKGILGVRKDPRNQILFSFSARQGDEWPSDDDEDADYTPGKDTDSEYEGSGTSKESQKRKIKDKKTETARKKKIKENSHETTEKRSCTSRIVQRNTSEYPAFDGELPSLPTEVWEKIFKIIVEKDGALPFLHRAARVCRLWNDISKRPHLWEKTDMSFGWLNLKESQLKSICENRLRSCRDLSVSGCKFMNHSWGVQAITDNCHNLRAINLSNCKKLPVGSVDKIVSSCKHLQDIDLSSTTVDAVAQQTLINIAEKCGPNLKRIVISENFAKNLSTFLTKIAEKCPNLEHLDISNVKWQSGHTYDIESFQRSCSKLKSFYSSNNVARAMPASQQNLQQSPGFPDLEELSLAALESNRLTTSDFIERFVKNATKLRLIDLRGCLSDRVVTVLKDIEADDVEQLYLARSQVASCLCLDDILRRWQHSLSHLDLSWNNFTRNSLDSGLDVLCDFCGESRMLQLSLAGTNVHMNTLKKILRKMTKLDRLDLSSCRDLDRGCKREYKSQAEINDLRKSLGL